MDSATFESRLSRIATRWSLVFVAHRGQVDAAGLALQALVQRYCGAIYRYLLGALRDPDAADELSQEFALRLVRGDFKNAAPGLGRFRDYLKVALVHLIKDHYRALANRPRQLPSDVTAPPAPVPSAEDIERDFKAEWRKELLERTWQALAARSSASHAVLRFRVENPHATSAKAAVQLSAQLGRPVTGAWVRKTQQRAHAKYADLLIEEVLHSLGEAGPGGLKQELEELDLLRYCRHALTKRSPGRQGVEKQ